MKGWKPPKQTSKNESVRSAPTSALGADELNILWSIRLYIKYMHLHYTWFQLYNKTTDFNIGPNMDESRCDAEREATKVSLGDADDTVIQLYSNCYSSFLPL